MVSPNPIACHLIPSRVPTQQLGHGSKCTQLLKDLIGNKQNISGNTHISFPILTWRKPWKNQRKHHAPPGFHTLFEEYRSFVLGDVPRTNVTLLSSHQAWLYFPSAPIRTSTPRSSMRLSISLFSEQNVLQMTSQNLEWKVMRTKIWAAQLFPFQTFASSFLVKDISSLDNTPFHLLKRLLVRSVWPYILFLIEQEKVKNFSKPQEQRVITMSSPFREIDHFLSAHERFKSLIGLRQLLRSFLPSSS